MNSAVADLYLPQEVYSFTVRYPITYTIPVPVLAPAPAAAAAPPAAINARSHERPATPPGERASKRSKREQPVVCKFCHRSMRTDNLERHQRNCRKNPDRDPKIPCPKCSKTFSRQDGLRRHMKGTCPGARERTFAIAGAWTSSEIPGPPHPIFSVTPMSYADGQPVALPATFMPEFPVDIATPQQFEPAPGPSQVTNPLVPETYYAAIFDTDYVWSNPQQDPTYPLSSGPTFNPSVDDGTHVDVPRYALPSEFQSNSLPGDYDANGLVGWPDFLDPVLLDPVFESDELP